MSEEGMSNEHPQWGEFVIRLMMALDKEGLFCGGPLTVNKQDDGKINPDSCAVKVLKEMKVPVRTSIYNFSPFNCDCDILNNMVFFGETDLSQDKFDDPELEKYRQEYVEYEEKEIEKEIEEMEKEDAAKEIAALGLA